MTDRRIPHAFDLSEVQAKDWPRLTWRDVFTSTGEAEPTTDEQSAMTEYLHRFTTPTVCPGCGETWRDGIAAMFGIGPTFTWGLAHGEGHCSGCGYPCRAYHFDVGPIKRFALVLPYHPEELRKVQ